MVRRQRMVAVALLLLLAPLVLLTSGCPKDPYTAAMAASLDISNGVNDGLTVITQLQQDKLITQAEMAKVATYLGNLTTLNGKFRTTVKSIHSANASSIKAAYIPAAEAFVTAASDPATLAALHVVNPAAEAKIQAVLTAINTALNGIQLAINSAKGA
jgi:hypothetical protein